MPPALAEVMPLYRAMRARGVPDHEADGYELWQVADVLGLGADTNLNGMVMTPEEFDRRARAMVARKVLALSGGGEPLEADGVDVPPEVLATAQAVSDDELEAFKSRRKARPVEDT